MKVVKQINAALIKTRKLQKKIIYYKTFNDDTPKIDIQTIVDFHQNTTLKKSEPKILVRRDKK